MSITNLIQSAASTAAKYANPANIVAGASSAISGLLSGGGAAAGLSSMPTIITPANPMINGVADTRVKLKIPPTYLVGHATGPDDSLVKAGGIIFPYTPTIDLEHKANYSGLNTPHSNYTQYFYKNSQVGEINLSAKFSVQNEIEAANYLSVVHVLRALTKMRFGDDANAGSPPPICRLMAYGDYMLDNVPVAITSFRQELPDGVDYFSTGKVSGDYGVTTVPVLSTFQISLIPIYSREELMNGTVDGWLYDNQRLLGYL